MGLESKLLTHEVFCDLFNFREFGSTFSEAPGTCYSLSLLVSSFLAFNSLFITQDPQKFMTLSSIYEYMVPILTSGPICFCPRYSKVVMKPRVPPMSVPV